MYDRFDAAKLFNYVAPGRNREWGVDRLAVSLLNH
jgi:hypothetical protein